MLGINLRGNILSQHIHILGICGTFMGGLALLAREMGLQVSGSDANIYPPMSTQLETQGIELMEGYHPEHLDPAPDMVLIGNAMSRGNPAVEYVLDQGLDYCSGPQWLADNILKDRWVLAVSGTHGKTTTSSLLAWLLEHAKLNPGFLIGGVPGNFGLSARFGDSPFFVVEADEYDSAFFDKRSKFVHYRPRTLAINNIEFDHADIFADLEAIQRQFHHLVRTVPANGLIIHRGEDEAIDELLAQGCWTRCQSFGIGEGGDVSASTSAGFDWGAEMIKADGSELELARRGNGKVQINSPMTGRHNVENVLAACAAAHHAGVPLDQLAQGIASFKGVRRRMELLAVVDEVTIYDDFAHHPTAIATTLEGLRASVGTSRIIAIIEPRSNTMRMGAHREALTHSTDNADMAFWFQPEGLDWSLQDVVDNSQGSAQLYRDIGSLVKGVKSLAQSGDHIVIMSNGSFSGVHALLIDSLKFKGRQDGQ